jgi:homocysteine S-methyltransferase
MPRYRSTLPQLDGGLFLTDGGLETSLIFDQGFDLPCFAAYPLVETDEGRAALRTYLDPYLEVARAAGTGFVIETPTWRANADWGAQLGHGPADLDRVNRLAVALAIAARDGAGLDSPVVVSGAIGPRGDGYDPGEPTTVSEAARYHHAQIATFADTEADLVTAMTITSTEEGAGLAQAARDVGMPVVIGFTVETDGRLPSGAGLGDAVTEVDDLTDGWVAYYMVNCAHPTHFADVLDPSAAWTGRIRSLRANASALSHAELDEATELDPGDPDDLSARYLELQRALPAINVVGGCCGTDHRHVAAIADALA